MKSEKETPQKDCPECEGYGVYDYGQGKTICPQCKGSGTVDMSEDEIYDDHQARKDWEAELNNDKT